MTESAASKKARLGRATARRAAEAVAGRLIEISGWSAIALLTPLAVFLVAHASLAATSPAAGQATTPTGPTWYPTSTPPTFAIRPPSRATHQGAGWTSARA